MARDVLIIGGTGVFGKRLVRHLSRQPDIVLHVSSRSFEKATAFIDTLKAAQATLHPVALDSQLSLPKRLEEIQPFVVVDCSGPFQGAGYATARTVLEAGAHFIDLADARDYLAGFSEALNETAHRHNVCALAGASSTPTLSTCVAKEITASWQRVDTIDMAITPGGKSEVGKSVIEAIMSYAGKDVPVWAGGRLSQTTGWRNAKRVNLPGLGHRRVATVETFDAEFLGPCLDVQSRVSFSAGLESRIEQLGMETIAALRKRGLIGAPNALIPLLLKARHITRIPTSSSGGMLVDARGLNADGVMTQSKWSLVARQDHGPYIPILPAAAAIRKLLSRSIKPGAELAHAAMSLSDILDEMQPYDIQTTTSQEHTEASILEQSLGASVFKKLPRALQLFHSSSGPVIWSGAADIQRGTGLLSRLIGRFFAFPQAGEDVPVIVQLDRETSTDGKPTETWTRRFSENPMQSVLSVPGPGLIQEQFWPFTFTLKLGHDANGIQMPVSEWRIGPCRLPLSLAPQSETTEYVDDQGRFRFDVKLSVPIARLLVHYRGWLEPDRDGSNGMHHEK